MDGKKRVAPPRGKALFRKALENGRQLYSHYAYTVIPRNREQQIPIKKSEDSRLPSGNLT